MLPTYLQPFETDIQSKLAPLLAGATTRTEMVHACARVILETTRQVPSAAVARHFVKRGSVTDIQRDLAEFRATVADAALPRLALPDLPGGLKLKLEDFADSVWREAQALAKQTWDEERAELTADRDNAMGALEQERQVSDGLREQIDVLQVSLEQAHVKLATAEEELQRTSTARDRATEFLARAEADLIRERSDRAKEAERFDAEIGWAKTQIEAARAEGRAAKEAIKALERTVADRQTEIDAHRQARNGLEGQLAHLKMLLAAERDTQAVKEKERRRMRMRRARRAKTPLRGKART